MRRTFVGSHEKLTTGKDYTLTIARGMGLATAFVETEFGEVTIDYNSLSEIAKNWKSIAEPKEESKKKKKKRRK